jgi:hypothetical protein
MASRWPFDRGWLVRASFQLGYWVLPWLYIARTWKQPDYRKCPQSPRLLVTAWREMILLVVACVSQPCSSRLARPVRTHWKNVAGGAHCQVRNRARHRHPCVRGVSATTSYICGQVGRGRFLCCCILSGRSPASRGHVSRHISCALHSALDKRSAMTLRESPEYVLLTCVGAWAHGGPTWRGLGG